MNTEKAKAVYTPAMTLEAMVDLIDKKIDVGLMIEKQFPDSAFLEHQCFFLPIILN